MLWTRGCRSKRQGIVGAIQSRTGFETAPLRHNLVLMRALAQGADSSLNPGSWAEQVQSLIPMQGFVPTSCLVTHPGELFGRKADVLGINLLRILVSNIKRFLQSNDGGFVITNALHHCCQVNGYPCAPVSNRFVIQHRTREVRFCLKTRQQCFKHPDGVDPRAACRQFIR